MQAIREGTYGSAVIRSTQPVVAIVNDVDITGRLDAAIYNGIGADSGAEVLGLPYLHSCCG
jgi:hypothetical protein